MKKEYRQLQNDILERELIASDYEVARACLNIKGISDVKEVSMSSQIPEPTIYEFITCLGDLLGQDQDFQKMTTRQFVKKR